MLSARVCEKARDTVSAPVSVSALTTPSAPGPSEPTDSAPVPSVDMAGMSLVGAELADWRADGADLCRADLSAANLAGARLSDARLHGARLRAANLSGVVGHRFAARDSDFEGAVLDRASLAEADFTGAVLLESSLRDANLSGGSLRGADLRGVDFRGADLRRVDLSRADLRGALLDNAQLDGIRARAARIDPGALPPELAEFLLEQGARPPGHLLQTTATWLGPVVGRVGRASGRWALATLERQWSSVREVWKSVRREGGRQLTEARDLQARLRDQRQADRKRIAAVAAARRERARRDAGRSGAAEARARSTRATADFQLVDPSLLGDRPPTLAPSFPEPVARSLRTAPGLSLQASKRFQALVEERVAQAEAAAANRRAEQEARRQVALQRADAARQKREQQRSEALAEQERLEALAEQERLEALAEQERLEALAEQERLEALAEQERLEALAEQERLEALAEQQRLEAERQAAELARLTEEAHRREAEARFLAEQEAAAAREQQVAQERETRRAEALRLKARAEAEAQRTLEVAARTAREERERQAAEQRALAERQRLEAAAREQAEARARIAAAEARRLEAQRAQDERLRQTTARRLEEQRKQLDQAQKAAEAARERADAERARLEAEAERSARETPKSPPIRSEPRAAFIAETRARLDTLQARGERAREEARAATQLPPVVSRSPEPQPVASPPQPGTEHLDETDAAPVPSPSHPLRRFLRLLPGGRSAADVPDGPGVRLVGADLSGRRLGERTWVDADLTDAHLDTARLEGADLTGATLVRAKLDAARLSRIRLDGADLTDATLEGARLRDGSLQSAIGRGARLVDADLRGADLTDADLTGADLTGVDLRRAILRGASLVGANLTAARLSDLSLDGVDLTDADLDQADLAGVDWAGSTVRGAKLAGALGISGRDREALARAGALARDESLDRLIGRVASRQVRAAVAILVLGLGTFLGARYIADQNPAPAVLEQRAEDLRTTDPLAAAEVYAKLAASSQRLSDRVGYLIEAGDLADQAGATDVAGQHYAAALEEAGDDPALSTDVRLRAAASLVGHERWDEVAAMVDPVLESEGQPADLRARALLFLLDAAVGMGTDPIQVEATHFQRYSDRPEAEADLRLSLAELLSTRDSLDLALAHLSKVAELDVAVDQRARALDARARILDRDGRLNEAAAAYADLEAFATPGSHTAQAARLALADLRHRQGDAEGAQDLVQTLLSPDTDDGIRARALMVSGRLFEQSGELDKARDSWQAALDMDGIEPETIEEARMSLARLLLASGDDAAIEAALAGLPPEAREGILVHARLGEGRRFLDAGKPDRALEVYEAIVNNEAAERSMRRAARAGQAECLAALGEVNEAVRIWREQLADDPTAEERTWLELQLAHGLIQGGEYDEAAAAFASLAASTDPDIRFQGILGQADLARLRGEAQRARSLYRSVIDRSKDNAFKIRALQEVADLAAEEGRPDEAREAWSTLLAIVPAGDPVSVDARTALMSDLAGRGRLEDALSMCRQAEATAPDPERRYRASLACAELLEQSGSLPDALEDYTALLQASVPLDIRMDAALGASRVAVESTQPERAVASIEAVLPEVEAEAQRLPLLSALLTALQQTGDLDRLEEVRTQRNTIARQRPEAAGPILTEAAQQARTAGQIDEAITLFEEVASLPVPDTTRFAAMLELADTLNEDGRPADAVVWFETVLQGAPPESTEAASARLGAGQAHLAAGSPEGAVATLTTDLDPTPQFRRSRLELLARAQTSATEWSAALETWSALAELAEDDLGVRAAALRGRGDVLFATDRYADAREAYQEAEQVARDPAVRGWANIGQADALAALGDTDAAVALYESISDASDPEVAAQARIRHAQLHLGAERWETAIETLAPLDAAELGPGWDATLTEARCAALIGLGQTDQATDQWRQLEARWPNAEEARLPAWLGLADLAASTGDTDGALELAKRALDETDDPGYRSRAEAILASNRP